MRNRVFIIFFILNISCASESSRSTQRLMTTEIDPQDTLDYTYHTNREISPYFIVDSTQTDTAYYQITYPVFENKMMDTLIRTSIFIDREHNAQDAARSFLDAFDEFVEENSTEQIHAAWYRESNSNIILNTPLFITLQTSFHEYTGGAHGNHVTIFSVFDAQRFKKVELSDLIITGRWKDLTRIAEKQFRKQENLSDTSTLSKDFFFEDGIFTLNDNFGFTKDKLLIFYNEYEIRPYSEGITKLEIPYTEIFDILNERGKRYIKNITH